ARDHPEDVRSRPGYLPVVRGEGDDGAADEPYHVPAQGRGLVRRPLQLGPQGQEEERILGRILQRIVERLGRRRGGLSAPAQALADGGSPVRRGGYWLPGACCRNPPAAATACSLLDATRPRLRRSWLQGRRLAKASNQKPAGAKRLAFRLRPLATVGDYDRLLTGTAGAIPPRAGAPEAPRPVVVFARRGEGHAEPPRRRPEKAESVDGPAPGGAADLRLATDDLQQGFRRLGLGFHRRVFHARQKVGAELVAQLAIGAEGAQPVGLAEEEVQPGIQPGLGEDLLARAARQLRHLRGQPVLVDQASQLEDGDLPGARHGAVEAAMPAEEGAQALALRRSPRLGQAVALEELLQPLAVEGALPERVQALEE